MRVGVCNKEVAADKSVPSMPRKCQDVKIRKKRDTRSSTYYVPRVPNGVTIPSQESSNQSNRILRDIPALLCSPPSHGMALLASSRVVTGWRVNEPRCQKPHPVRTVRRVGWHIGP